MDFKSYIKNWSSNFKNYTLYPELITKQMKSHINNCRICRGPITFYTICQDKYLSQLFVQQLHWRIPKLFFSGTGNEFTSDIYNNLPSNYVMKMTHGCGGKECISVRNKKIINKRIILSFNSYKKWMNDKYVICEEYLLDKNDLKYPIDYKCYVFNGIIKYICVVRRSLSTASLYTADFKKKFKFKGINENIENIMLSESALETMKKYCSDLTMFTNLFLRVDFYIINDEVIFGEFTPNPHNGHHYSREMIMLMNKDIYLMKKNNESIW